MENTNLYYCSESIPTITHFFDFSYAPTLLFYAYIPIIILSLFLGFFVFFKNKYSLQAKLMLGLSLSFSFWIINIMFQWVAVYARVVQFSAQITAMFETIIFISTTYFVYVFVNKKDIPFTSKVLLGTVFSTIAVLLPTKINIISFDIVNCQSNVGVLWNYIYPLEIGSIFYIIYISLKKYFSFDVDKIFKKQILYFMSGVVFFLTFFSLSNILGEITQTYQINLFGPIGMVIFLGLLSYMIVEFKTFNIKILGTQVLILGLVVLIGSQFFFIRTTTNRILNGLTFVSAIIFGYFLIKSVKKEVEQKEELAQLNDYLEDLVKQRESLVHLITHKVKSSFTHSKYIFAEMLENTFGAISPELKKMAENGLESTNGGIQTVDLVLNAANLTKGMVKYDMKVMNFKDLVLKSAEDKKIGAEAKGLKLEVDIKENNYNTNGDPIWLKEVVNNLIENSIKYTKEGTILVKLENGNGKIKLSVKDSGVGITDEDKKKLFTEGGRGKDSVKVNVDSTGYGLYTVKLVVEAHKGTVSVETEAGKGSTFFVELPIVA